MVSLGHCFSTLFSVSVCIEKWWLKGMQLSLWCWQVVCIHPSRSTGASYSVRGVSNSMPGHAIYTVVMDIRLWQVILSGHPHLSSPFILKKALSHTHIYGRGVVKIWTSVALKMFLSQKSQATFWNPRPFWRHPLKYLSPSHFHN